MKTEDFIELFPYREEELKIWEQFIDENGEINNTKHYAALISSRLKQKDTKRAANRLRKRHKPKL